MADLLHPTLVSPKNFSTAPVAFSSHSHLTAGALGFSHPQSLPISLHNNVLICGAHALHSTNK